MPFNVIDPSTAEPAPVATDSLGAPKVDYGKTLLSMETALQLMLLGRDDITSPRLREWINDAYLDVCSSLTLPQLLVSYGFTTVSGSPFYLLPAAVEYTRGVSIIDPDLNSIYGGRPLSKIDLDAYRREMDETGEPYAYFREGDVLVVFPTPDAAFTLAVDAKIQPLPLTADNHSPILPRQWHEVILKCARAKAFDELQEFENALVAHNVWQDMVRRKQDPKAEEQMGRLIGSSIPQTRRDLIRARRRNNDAY